MLLHPPGGRTEHTATRPAKAPARRLRAHLRSPVVQAALAGMAGMLLIGLGSLFASQQAGRAEAMNDARTRTELLARAVLEPNLTDDLLAGDPAAIARLDDIVGQRVLDGSTIRVKLWDATGRVVYADDHRLIGERYELDDDKIDAMRDNVVISEVSDLDGRENRFETVGQALEVYLPITGPSGERLLFESYYSMDAVAASSARIRSQFAPIVVAALIVMQLMNLALAWGLNRRLRRGQAVRETLLRQAIESSLLERRRIAARLHDGVVQDLSDTTMAITAAAKHAAGTSPEVARDLAAASTGARRSLQSLRSLLVDIYPPDLAAQGLEAALVDLLAPAASMGVETELVVSGHVDRSPETTALVYRVVQEAVRNVFTHARARSMKVHVVADAGSTTATVVDDGCGLRPAHSSRDGHLGLRLLADLVDGAGAHLLVESTPGAGTSIRLEVPA